MHIVLELKANILLGIDITRLEDMLIDLIARQVTLRSYKNVRFLIKIKRRLAAEQFSQVVRAS